MKPSAIIRLATVLAAGLLASCAGPDGGGPGSPAAAAATLQPLRPVSISSSAGSDELVRLALQRNPSLRVLRERAARLAQKPAQDRAYPDPTAEVAAGNMAETAAGKTDAFAAIKQKIPFPGKLREAAAASASEAAAANRELAAMELRIIEQVRSAWWDFHLAAETDRLTRESKDLLGAVRSSVDAKVAAGQSSQADQLRLANENSQLDKDLAESRRMTATARARLNALLDRDAGAPLPTARATPVSGTAGLEALLARAAARHPEIEAANLHNQAFRHRLARAELEKYPDLTVGAAGAAIDSSGLSPMSNGRDQLYATLGFNIPLWQEPRRAMIREAQAGMRETDAMADATRADLRFRIEDAWNRATAAREIIGLFESRLIPDASQAHQLALADYSGDRAPFNDVIDTWRQLLAYKLQIVAARSQLGKADAALRSAACLDATSAD